MPWENEPRSRSGFLKPPRATAPHSWKEPRSYRPWFTSQKGDSPPENFGNLAAVRLGSLLAEFTDAAVANPNDPAALHRLRILGKRLRYSLEIMAGCFPPTFRTVLYPAVEQLQEHLGGIQDAGWP